MLKNLLAKSFILGIACIVLAGFSEFRFKNAYESLYFSRLEALSNDFESLSELVAHDKGFPDNREALRKKIHQARISLKKADFWLRYFEPTAYKKINGPLPVEWESEVFEKYEKPYKRIGKGLILAELALDEPNLITDSFINLLKPSIQVINTTFKADSITSNLSEPAHLFFANRLYLMNLAALYTTGFECPDTSRVIPEIKESVQGVIDIFEQYEIAFRSSYPEYAGQAQKTIILYRKLLKYLNNTENGFENFNRFQWIREINPLYIINAQFLLSKNVKSKNFNDYAIDNNVLNLYDKQIFIAQNRLGLYASIRDNSILEEIEETGRLLFNDPVLSGNNLRSCASCHKPDMAFTDTMVTTAVNYYRNGNLKRNTPGLLNVTFNHLLMVDGKHYNMQDQGIGVITNPEEMGGLEKDIVKKINSIPVYKKAFAKFQKLIPGNKVLTLRHIASAITAYTGNIKTGSSLFHSAFESNNYSSEAIKGFNLFMGKAQCGTCHFFPVFNGSKPPYIGSEFEVIGTPGNIQLNTLSNDSGRYLINPASETLNAFRTPTLLNISYTAPYMHNGIYKTIDEVINFYDAGGGQGMGINVPNQTLSGDSLHLTPLEKKQLRIFLESLNETLPPKKKEEILLPKSRLKYLNARKSGGVY